ncbi:MAG: hypothetical protein V9G19_12435 [Tetrasphaera sp.]
MSTRTRWWLTALVLLLTVIQLAVGAFSGLPQFAGKGFGARLWAYPLMMLLVPAIWWGWRTRAARAAGEGRAAAYGRGVWEDGVPWGAFALIMLPFLVDVSGNTLDLYDAVVWWDDANHFVNWIFLNAGLGLLLLHGIERPWARVLLVTGLGAILAIGWELGEWYTFIRHGTELDTAYQDTLGDEALGTLGALVAGLLLARNRKVPAPGRDFSQSGRAV